MLAWKSAQPSPPCTPPPPSWPASTPPAGTTRRQSCSWLKWKSAGPATCTRQASGPAPCTCPLHPPPSIHYRTDNVLGGSRKVGPEISRRVHQLLTCRYWHTAPLHHCTTQDRHSSADLQKSAATPFCSAEAKIAAADGSICGLLFVLCI